MFIVCFLRSPADYDVNTFHSSETPYEKFENKKRKDNPETFIVIWLLGQIICCH